MAATAGYATEDDLLPTTVDEYVQALEEGAGALMSQLRQLIASAAPEAEESLKWGMPHYDQNGDLLYLDAKGDHVTLGFFRGAEIQPSDDPMGLLEGTGEKLRHVKVFMERELQVDALRALIHSALRVNLM